MSNRLVIIGAGRIGTDLISRMSNNFEIVCIEQGDESLKDLEPLQESRKITVIQGDATSRLILEQARVDEADVVVLTVSSEAINLEAARVLREKFNVPRIVAIGISSEGIAELEALDVEVVNVFKASAHSILNLIQSAIRTPQEIGSGQGEILELTVHPRSRLTHKPLARLVPLSWRVGLIYRNEKVIVPDGRTRLMPNDRVIILGDPSVVKTLSELLTFSTHDFPLEYGSLALVYLGEEDGEAYFSEVEYLLKTFPFREVVFMLSPRIKDPGRLQDFFDRCPHLYTIHASENKRPMASILESAGILRRNCGLIIGNKKTLLGNTGMLPYRNKRVRLISRTLEQLYAPILFCAGTFPYQGLAVPAIPPADVKPLLETALEISGQMASDLSVFHCSPSAYTGGEEEKTASGKIKKTVSDMGLLFKRKIPVSVLTGNPVHQVTRAVQELQLLLLEPMEWDRRPLFSLFFRPDPVIHLLARSPISTLLQPPENVKKESPAALDTLS
jgi:Trk K+ transport system NAD-binding subunit